MKKTQLTLILLVFTTAFSFAQVGIKTDDPQRTLDVNGNIRIRSTADVGADATYDRVLLSDSDGTNTQGNIDYNTVDDFRLKMLDLSSLTQTQINNINKYLGGPVCVKGPIGDGGQPADVIQFPSGYEFRVQDVGGGLGEIQVRTTGVSRSAERTATGGTIASTGAMTVNANWNGVGTSSFQISNSGEVVLIMAGTAETFEITLTQKNTSGNKIYSLCVAQTQK